MKNTHLFELEEVKPEDLDRLNHLKREKKKELNKNAFDGRGRQKKGIGGWFGSGEEETAKKRLQGGIEKSEGQGKAEWKEHEADMI